MGEEMTKEEKRVIRDSGEGITKEQIQEFCREWTRGDPVDDEPDVMLRAICNIAISALALREKRGGWIAVSEKLPEDGIMCAVIDDGEVTIGLRYSGKRGKKKIVHYAGWQVGEEVREGAGTADEYRNTITHWMPLPAAAKAGERT